MRVVFFTYVAFDFSIKCVALASIASPNITAGQWLINGHQRPQRNERLYFQ